MFRSVLSALPVQPAATLSEIAALRPLRFSLISGAFVLGHLCALPLPRIDHLSPFKSARSYLVVALATHSPLHSKFSVFYRKLCSSVYPLAFPSFLARAPATLPPFFHGHPTVPFLSPRSPLTEHAWADFNFPARDAEAMAMHLSTGKYQCRWINAPFYPVFLTLSVGSPAVPGEL